MQWFPSCVWELLQHEPLPVDKLFRSTGELLSNHRTCSAWKNDSTKFSTDSLATWASSVSQVNLGSILSRKEEFYCIKICVHFRASEKFCGKFPLSFLYWLLNSNTNYDWLIVMLDIRVNLIGYVRVFMWYAMFMEIIWPFSPITSFSLNRRMNDGFCHKTIVIVLEKYMFLHKQWNW